MRALWCICLACSVPQASPILTQYGGIRVVPVRTEGPLIYQNFNSVTASCSTKTHTAPWHAQLHLTRRLPLAHYPSLQLPCSYQTSFSTMSFAFDCTVAPFHSWNAVTGIFRKTLTLFRISMIRSMSCLFPPIQPYPQPSSQRQHVNHSPQESGRVQQTIHSL